MNVLNIIRFQIQVQYQYSICLWNEHENRIRLFKII